MRSIWGLGRVVGGGGTAEDAVGRSLAVQGSREGGEVLK